MYVQKIYSKANLKCKKKNTYTRRLLPLVLASEDNKRERGGGCSRCAAATAISAAAFAIVLLPLSPLSLLLLSSLSPLPPSLFLLLLLPLSCCRFRRWCCCFHRHRCCCCRRRHHRHRRCCTCCHRCRTHDPLVEPLLRLSSLLHSFVHPRSHLHCSPLFGPCPCSSAPALGFVRPSPFSPSLLRARLYLHLYYLSNTT
jgi:hypothetical protein